MQNSEVVFFCFFFKPSLMCLVLKRLKAVFPLLTEDRVVSDEV